MMERTDNLMPSIWFGEISDLSLTEIKEKIMKAETEKDVLFNLMELYKMGDFTQKPLLIQLMNQTNHEAVLNLCIRVFFSIANHEDLQNPSHFQFLNEATQDTIDTFSSAAITSLSYDVIPYLLALLEDWDDIEDTAIVIRDSIDFFIDFEDSIGEEAPLEEIGDFYLDYQSRHHTEKYYFLQKLVFPGDLAKRLIERVFIAARYEEPLRMELIPSLLSIWTGEKVPGDYHTIINEKNYKEFINYVDKISTKDWEKGQKYFYGYKV